MPMTSQEAEAEAVLVVVVPDPVHPAMIVVEHVVCVIVSIVKLLNVPDKKDVKREIVWVQTGIAVLPVQEEDAEALKEVVVNPSVEDNV